MEEDLKPWNKIHLKDFENITAYRKEYAYLKADGKVAYRRDRYGKFPTFEKWLFSNTSREDYLGDLARKYAGFKGTLSYKHLNETGNHDDVTLLKMAKKEYDIRKEGSN